MLVHRLGAMALNAGDPARARPFVEESLATSAEIGNRRIELLALGSLADIELREGNPERARELALQSLAFCQGDRLLVVDRGDAEPAGGRSQLSLDRLDEPESRGREALRVSREIADRYGVVYGLAVLAWIASARDYLSRAGELWGAVEAEEARGPIRRLGAATRRDGKRTSCGRARPSRAGVPAAARCRSMRRSSGRSPPTTLRQGPAAPAPADPAGS